MYFFLIPHHVCIIFVDFTVVNRAKWLSEQINIPLQSSRSGKKSSMNYKPEQKPWGWYVALFSNPLPISDQNLLFSVPYFRTDL